MAKLSAYDRRMWIFAEKGDERRAYMGDGMVLRKTRDRAGKWSGWRVWGQFSRVRPLKETKAELVAQGWALLEVPMERMS